MADSLPLDTSNTPDAPINPSTGRPDRPMPDAFRQDFLNANPGSNETAAARAWTFYQSPLGQAANDKALAAQGTGGPSVMEQPQPSAPMFPGANQWVKDNIYDPITKGADWLGGATLRVPASIMTPDSAPSLALDTAALGLAALSVV